MLCVCSYLQLQLRLPQPCAVPAQEHPSTDLGPRAGDIVASVEDLVFAAASAMVFLGPQPPPMPPPAAAVPELDEPLDPSSAARGGWGTEEAVVATAAGGARQDNEHNRGEPFNVGLSSPPLASPGALFGSVEGGFAALGAADGGQAGPDSGHGQPGGPVEFRVRGSSTSPPADMLLSSGSPASRSPVGGGRGGGGPSVFGEVGGVARREVLVPSWLYRLLYSEYEVVGWEISY